MCIHQGGWCTCPSHGSGLSAHLDRKFDYELKLVDKALRYAGAGAAAGATTLDARQGQPNHETKGRDDDEDGQEDDEEQKLEEHLHKAKAATTHSDVFGEAEEGA